ncbi:MAG: exosortase H [Gammaproteobacteria bacterium]
MRRYFGVFAGVLLLLFTLELLNPVREVLIVPITRWIAACSAYLINLFDARIVSQGVVIQNPVNGFAVEIAAGCNGVEPIIVLTAAIIAFPSTFLSKCVGVVVGAFAIQALNIVRVISLFYLGQWDKEVFEWAHLYLWQALIILDALVVWLIWLRYSQAPRRVA